MERFVCCIFTINCYQYYLCEKLPWPFNYSVNIFVSSCLYKFRPMTELKQKDVHSQPRHTQAFFIKLVWKSHILNPVVL